MDYDFLNEDMDFSSVEGIDKNIAEVHRESNMPDESRVNPVGAPTDGIDAEDPHVDPNASGTGSGEDDWDSYIEEQEDVVEMSDEDKAQLELANKTVPGMNFKTLDDFREYLKNPKGKVDEEEVVEKKKDSLEVVVETETAAINQIKRLLESDPEELLRLKIRREDPDISEDDLDLEIEGYRNSGSFNSKVRGLKNALKNNIKEREGKIESAKQAEIDQREQKQVQKRKELQSILKNRKTLFDSFDVSEDLNKAVYKRIVSGEFVESLKDNHEEVAKLATLQVMEEEIKKAFKSLKQSGYAFESGKFSLYKNISNVKPRTQGGSADLLGNMFDTGSKGMSLEDISMDGMEFLDDKK